MNAGVPRNWKGLRAFFRKRKLCKETCVCRHSCCSDFRQLDLPPAAVPGRPASPLKGRTEAREKAGGKIRLGENKRSFRLFSPAPLPCLCFARELAWRHIPNWRRLFVLRPEAGSPEWVQGASSARKLIQWINFSEGGPVGPGSRSSRTFPLQRLFFHSYHGF